MTPPIFQIAVRDKDGKPHLFRVQHEEIADHEQAIALPRGEFPGAQAVLCSVLKVAA